MSLQLKDMDTWWLLRRGKQFSLRVWLLIGRPCSSGWPHTQKYTGSPNWSLRVIKLKTKKGQDMGMGK